MGGSRDIVRRVVVRATAAVAYGALLFVERRPATRVGAGDVRVTRVNDAIELRARWIDRPGEIGPTWSAFGGRHEIVRVDMFPGCGHAHPAMGALLATNVSGVRYELPNETLDQIVEAGVDECRRHLAFHVACHPWRRLRRSVPTPDEVASASAWLAQEVDDLVAIHRDEARRPSDLGQPS